MMLFARDPDRTAGVGSPEMTESERRICDVAKVGCKVTQVDYTDTSAPRVRVGIGDPEDEDGYIESAWLPIAHGRSNEWNPLKVGEVVMVISEAGEYQNGVVIPAAVHNTDNPAPGDRVDLYRKTFANGGLVEYDEAAGTMALKSPTSILAQVAATEGDSSTGSSVLLEVSKVTISLGDNASIVLEDSKITLKAGDTQYVLDGSTHAFTGGDATFDQTVTADTDVVGGGISLKDHTHKTEHVQGGSATLESDAPS